MELIDLVNSVLIFLSQTTLLRWLTLLLGSQIAIFTNVLFWNYFFLLALVFVPQSLSLHWGIVIMLLSQFPLTFHQIPNGIPHLKDVTWEDIFKLSASCSEFYEQVQVGIGVYIPHSKYKVEPHSSPWFPPESEVNFRQASNCCNRVLETATIAYANKRINHFPETFMTFGELPIVFSTKVNPLYLLYSTARRCCCI